MIHNDTHDDSLNCSSTIPIEEIVRASLPVEPASEDDQNNIVGKRIARAVNDDASQNTLLDRVKKSERWMIGLTIIVAFSAVGQLLESHLSNKESSVQGADMIAAANTNAIAAKQSARAAIDFAAAGMGINTNIAQAEKDFSAIAQNSAASVMASMEQIRLDQRAWVAVGSIEGIPELDKPFTTKVTVRNTGKTFAKDFRMAVVVDFGPSHSPTFDEEAKVHRGSIDLLAPNGLYMAVNRITGAGSERRLANPNQAALDSIKSGSTSVFIHGRMDYNDIFARQHWTTFCAELDSALEWRICGTHNDADAN